MADAGFIHRPEFGASSDKSGSKADAVTCDRCTHSRHLRNWIPEDNPIIEHISWYPDCEFAQMVKESIDLATINDSDLGDFPEPHYMRLVTVYCTAEKYSMTELKNGLIDILFRLKRTEPRVKPPSMSVVSVIYNRTTTKSPLRKLMVAWYVFSQLVLPRSGCSMGYDFGHNSCNAMYIEERKTDYHPATGTHGTLMRSGMGVKPPQHY